MPSPICTVNSTVTTDGVDVTAASEVTIELADTAGVNTWSVQCVSTDELLTAAGVNAGLTINSLTKTASFTAPGAGSALIFKSVVNNGRDVNGRIDPALTTTFGVFVRTATLLRAGAFNETLEGSANFGWVVKYNEMIRSAMVVAPGVAGDGLYFAGSAYNVGAADGTIVINADSIQVGVLADANHGSLSGGALHALASGGAAGFMSTTHYNRVQGATSSASNNTLCLRDGAGGAEFTSLAAGTFSTSIYPIGYLRSDDNSTLGMATGSIVIKTGNQGNLASSGALAMNSGQGSSGSGAVTYGSGVAINGTSGALAGSTGAGPATGSLSLTTGAASLTTSGAITMVTGNALTNAGGISLTTGASTGTGRGGALTLSTGGSSGGSSRGGDIALAPGLGAGGRGNITLGGSLGSFGNGTAVVAITGTGLAPTASVASTYLLYIDPIDAKLKARGPSGTINTIAIP